MKQAQLKSMIMFILFVVLGAIFVLAAVDSVTLNFPLSGWVNTSSIDFNFTPSMNIVTIPWCGLYSNRTDNWNITANYTSVANGTPHVRGIAFTDTGTINSYNWTVGCYNGSELITASENLSFGVDSVTPLVTLDSPNNNQYISINHTTLAYTPTDSSNLAACYLWHNISGTWQLNETNASVNTGVQDLVNISNVTDVGAIWNVFCNDSSGKGAWSPANRSFTVDLIPPESITWLSTNNTFSVNRTQRVVWNKTIDANFESYVIRLSTNSSFSDVVQIITRSNITYNETNVTNMENDGVYYIRVTAADLAGNTANTTTAGSLTNAYDLYFNLEREALALTLHNPTNNSYVKTNQPYFNVTPVGINPDSCILYLSNVSGTALSINATNSSLTNNTPMTIRPLTAMTEGVYQFNIGCNNSAGIYVNVTNSSGVLNVTIDTTDPTNPQFSMDWGQPSNNTDLSPTLDWLTVTETNFDRYLAQAHYIGNGTVAYGVNVTNRTHSRAVMDLSIENTYNFSVTAYDLAQNTASQTNGSNISYYTDSVCGNLSAGWNFCGAVWKTGRNLSQIGGETNATFVSVWNMSSHKWATCNYAVSAGGSNCYLNVSIGTYHNLLGIPAGIGITNQSGADVSGLTAGKHFYKVAAVTLSGGLSIASSEVETTTNVTHNTTRVTWTAVLDADRYRIYNGSTSGNQTTYMVTGNTTSFNHTGNENLIVGIPPTAHNFYVKTPTSSTVWVYVNDTTSWKNRTWEATQLDMNYTLTNITNRWNNIAGIFRNGKVFGDIGRDFGQDNVTMLSMPYINGTTVPYLNLGNTSFWRTINNETDFTFGRAMWVYTNATGVNGTGSTTWATGGW